MGTLMFLMGIAFLGFVVYLTIKQIEFIVKAIPLYQEMVSNQKEIIFRLDTMITKNNQPVTASKELE